MLGAELVLVQTFALRLLLLQDEQQECNDLLVDVAGHGPPLLTVRYASTVKD